MTFLQSLSDYYKVNPIPRFRISKTRFGIGISLWPSREKELGYNLSPRKSHPSTISSSRTFSLIMAVDVSISANLTVHLTAALFNHRRWIQRMAAINMPTLPGESLCPIHRCVSNFSLLISRSSSSSSDFLRSALLCFRSLCFSVVLV